MKYKNNIDMNQLIVVLALCPALMAVGQSNVSKPKAFNVVKEVKPPVHVDSEKQPYPH